MTALQDMSAAIRLLTVLPVRGAEGNRPAACFSWVGWLFAAIAGAVATGAVAIEASRGLGALLAAVLVIAAWGVLSGMLHWDGLADTADGVGARGGVEARLAVMRDSSVGAFGVVAIVLVALAQVAAMALVIETRTWWAVGAPVLGRWAAGYALWHSAPARTDGLGARYAVRGSIGEHLVSAVAVLPVLLVPFPPSVTHVVAVLLCMVVAVLLPKALARRIGGITGDVLGATVVLVETIVLVVGAVVGVAV